MKQWILRLSILGVLPFSLACQKGFETQTTEVGSFSSQSPGNGGLAIHFNSPLAGMAPQGMIGVSVSVSPINNLQSLRLSINDKPVKIFSRLPFEYQLDPAQYSGHISLKAETKDINGNINSEIIVLTRPGSTNCMNNNSFDACLFRKNPVAQKGSAFAQKIQFGDDLSLVQTHGVTLTNLKNPNSLSNNSITVSASAGQKATPTGGSWRIPYQTDTGHFNAQLMAYYWLTLQETEMVSRSGSFFAKNKNIQVDAYNSSVKDNAYWDSEKVVMGFASTNGAPAHEMALSSEVYMHEMGHANLQFAVGGFQNISPNSNYETGNNCKTSAGCITGINEGQADFHFLIIFNDSTSLGETWLNRVEGLASRDVKKNQSLTASQAFASSNGEVHAMGSLYAATLWSIYSNPLVSKTEFEKIFTSHLQKLTGSSRYVEARDALIASDLVLFGGKYKTIIQTAFTNKGIQ